MSLPDRVDLVFGLVEFRALRMCELRTRVLRRLPGLSSDEEFIPFSSSESDKI